jgi:hypothetical protein
MNRIRIPSSGDVVFVGPAASVQFDGLRALVLRVISVQRESEHDRWAWLTGYVLDRSGRATVRREVYVRLAGLRFARPRRTGTGGAPTG